MRYRLSKDEKGAYLLKVTKYGQELLNDPLLNKGTAFPAEDRSNFGLEGLLPPYASTMEEQLTRVRGSYDIKRSNVSKYVFLRSLQDRNETLFYAFLRRYINEMLPIIYTPTIGDAVEQHGHLYRKPRGLFIDSENVGKMEEMAKHLPSAAKDLRIIVVTDSQGILGIGDQGVSGMAIPVGKLSRYTVAAGIHPSQCLPICLDVGTDNQKLLDDPLYLGSRQKRIKGAKYDSFIEKMVDGVKKNFPNAILQWEDFSKSNAFKNMDSFREAHPSFNDDIEGTGAVTLGGVISAMKIKREKLSDQKFAIYGAGAAGVGIARQLKAALLLEGMSEQDAAGRIFIIDSRGLICDDRAGLEDYKKEFAKPRTTVERWLIDNLHEYSLPDVVRNGRITVLIGVSAQKDSFNKEIVDMMMENSVKPVIFTLSNPTSKSEADPRWLLEYTLGRAIVASGSPFAPVTVNGKEYEIGQGNNALIFPGIGLGAIVAKARVIKPSFFASAAFAMAEAVPKERLDNGVVYPDFEDLFEISFNVAKAVYLQARKEGVGRDVEGDIEEAIRERMWIPSYSRYVK